MQRSESNRNILTNYINLTIEGSKRYEFESDLYRQLPVSRLVTRDSRLFKGPNDSPQEALPFLSFIIPFRFIETCVKNRFFSRAK